jgi:hypothetical protein
MRKLLASIFAVTLVLVAAAGASLVTSLPGGTVIALPAVDYFGGGPITFGPGITWTSTNCAACNQGGSVFGYTVGYSFLGNGQWTGALGPMAGLNDSTDFYGTTDTMTFTFANPVNAVGGFLNYVPFSSTPTTIAVWDSNGNLIESYGLTFVTNGGNDEGAFFGFLESGPIISAFTLTDNYIGIVDLTTATPEPSSLLLLGSGLLGVIGYGRRRMSR